MKSIQEKLKLRQGLKTATRQFFESRQYLEVETPVITRCPGTEVHLQYFETSWTDFKQNHHQKFLRSSPELHMKRIMAEGIDRIFQIAPCFRNYGEMSEWHNPEFSMLEWYQLNLSYESMIAETENYLRETAHELESITKIAPHQILPRTFEKIGVFDAFKDFANISLIDQDPDLARLAIEAGIHSVQPKDDFETAYFKILIEKIEPKIASLTGCILMDYPPSQAALSVVKNGRACRFEYYLGRVELCNGFYELTGEEENRTRVRESLQERIKHGYQPVPEDPLFFKAMGQLTSPCSGNALGYDRWLAILSKSKSLNDVVLFRDSFDDLLNNH